MLRQITNRHSPGFQDGRCSPRHRHVSKVENISGISTDDFTLMNKVLRRLERFLNDQILYRL